MLPHAAALPTRGFNGLCTYAAQKLNCALVLPKIPSEKIARYAPLQPAAAAVECVWHAEKFYAGEALAVCAHNVRQRARSLEKSFVQGKLYAPTPALCTHQPLLILQIIDRVVRVFVLILS